MYIVSAIILPYAKRYKSAKTLAKLVSNVAQNNDEVTQETLLHLFICGHINSAASTLATSYTAA